MLYVGLRNTGAESLPYCLAQLVDVKTDDGSGHFRICLCRFNASKGMVHFHYGPMRQKWLGWFQQSNMGETIEFIYIS